MPTWKKMLWRLVVQLRYINLKPYIYTLKI